MIIEYFSSGPLQTNVIIVGCEDTKQAAIFDPALGSAQTIKNLISKHHLKPIGIYLTHSHFDHIADCNQVKQFYKIPVFVHELDAKNVENPGSDNLPLFFPVEKTKVDDFLTEGQKIKIGNFLFEIIHTPGHSPGGICFYEKKQKLLISGDTLFKGTMGNLSLPTSNQNDMLQSLKKLSKLPLDTFVIPGHGEVTSIESEGWLNNLDQIF